MSAAVQLHRDACLMNTNLNILEQYLLSLHGAASKILEKTIGGDPYPAAAVAGGAKGPTSASRVGTHGGHGLMETLPSAARNNGLNIMNISHVNRWIPLTI